MSNTKAKTDLSPVQVGDKVNFSQCPAQLPNWGVRGRFGVVELVRRRIDGAMEAYVIVNRVRWIFPLAWLEKEVK